MSGLALIPLEQVVLGVEPVDFCDEVKHVGHAPVRIPCVRHASIRNLVYTGSSYNGCIKRQVNIDMLTMLTGLLREYMETRDPMNYIYILYCIFVCVGMVGVITELPGLWGTSIAAFCLVGVVTCYIKHREWRIPKIENTENA